MLPCPPPVRQVNVHLLSHDTTAYHSILDPLVRLVEEPVYEGLGVHRVLLESRERGPCRPVFHFTERFITYSKAMLGDVRAGTRSQSSEPGPPAATEADVHSSARVTSGSSQSLTIYPYVIFSIVPAAVKTPSEGLDEREEMTHCIYRARNRSGTSGIVGAWTDRFKCFMRSSGVFPRSARVAYASLR